MNNNYFYNEEFEGKKSLRDAFYGFLIFVIVVAFAAWIGGMYRASHDKESPADVDFYNANSIF